MEVRLDLFMPALEVSMTVEVFDRRDAEMSKDAPGTWLFWRSAYGIRQRTFVDRLLPL